jgi:hypothetical protein
MPVLSLLLVVYITTDSEKDLKLEAVATHYSGNVHKMSIRSNTIRVRVATKFILSESLWKRFRILDYY